VGIENADYIPELVQSSPLGSAAVAEGDNELRQLKKVLQQSFPDVPSGAIINAGENPSEPAEGLGEPTNVMLWSPLAIADFVKKYWSGWGLSPPSGQQSFKVYDAATGLSVPHNTDTKVEWPDVVYDPASWWDGTNFRYTPQEAGIWRFAVQYHHDPSSGAASSDKMVPQIRKNGSKVASARWVNNTTDELFTSYVECLVELNGTTDYVESWCFHDFGQTEQVTQVPTYADESFFHGHRIGDA